MAPQRKKIQFQSAEISAVTKNALVKPISAQTVNLFSTLIMMADLVMNGNFFQNSTLTSMSDVELGNLN